MFDQGSAIKLFENARWGDTIICPYCKKGPSKVYRCLDNTYQCNNCKHSFSAVVGTFLHGTKIPLKKWLELINIYVSILAGAEECKTINDFIISNHLKRVTVNKMVKRLLAAKAKNDPILYNLIFLLVNNLKGKYAG